MVILENKISHNFKHALWSPAVTLKPSGSWRRGAANAFLTVKEIGACGYAMMNILFFSLSLYSFRLPKSHIKTGGAVVFSQVEVKPPTRQIWRSETLVCPDSRTARATPAPLNFSCLGQRFGVTLGLQRKFIWGLHAKGRWPPGFSHDVEKAIKSRLNEGFSYQKHYFWA